MSQAVRVVDRVADMADWDQSGFADNYHVRWDAGRGKFVATPPPVSSVTSVFGRAGDVVLTAGDVTGALGYADIARLGVANTFTAPQVVAAAAVTDVPLRINGQVGQTGDLLQVGKGGSFAYFQLDSAGNIKTIGGQTARIQASSAKPYFPDGLIFSSVFSNQDGVTSFGGQTGLYPWLFQSAPTTARTLTVKGTAAQTVNTFEVCTSGFLPLFGVNVAGPVAKVTVQTPGAAGLVVQGAPSQTGNLQEWQNAAGLAKLAVQDMAGVNALLRWPNVVAGEVAGFEWFRPGFFQSRLVVDPASGNFQFQDGTTTRFSIERGTGKLGITALVMALGTVTNTTFRFLANGYAGSPRMDALAFATYDNGANQQNRLVITAGGTTSPGTADVRLDNSRLLISSAREPTFVGLIVQGAPSQTGSLQEWQDSTGAVRALVNNVGVSTQFQLGPLLPGGAASSNGINFDTAVGGTGSPRIRMWYSGNNDVQMTVANDGLTLNCALTVAGLLSGVTNFTAETLTAKHATLPYVRVWKTGQSWFDWNAASNNTLQLLNTGGVAVAEFKEGPARVKFAVKGEPSQTASLAEWQDSTGAVLATVDKLGRAIFPQVTLSTALALSGTAYIEAAGQTTNGATLLRSSIVGDPGYRFVLNNNGGMSWGPGIGTGARDVALARSSVGVLEVNNTTTGVFAALRTGSPSGNVTAQVVKAVNKTYSVTNKALTANVATLTTSAVNTLTVGESVVVSGVDATFDGTYFVTAVPTTTSFTYAKVAANVVSAVVSPAGAAVVAQVANLQEWQDSTGAVKLAISPAGSITAPAAMQVTAGTGISMNAQAGYGFSLVGSPFSIYANFNGANTPAMLIDTYSYGASLSPGLRIRAHGSQTGDLTQWMDQPLNVLSRVNKAGYFMTRKTAAPADADLVNSELSFWLDGTAGAAKVMFKAKDAAGTVVTGSLALT
jgi:hypothetical protein